MRCASALPAGPIDEAVFARFSAELRDGIIAGIGDGGWDAVYLSLHGAAITTLRQTPDLDLVRLVRGLLPQVPVGASFDLHGNMAPEFAALLDVASVYRTHPHIDMAETAARVLDEPMRCAEGTLQTRRGCATRGAARSFNMRTNAGPMREIEDAARKPRPARSARVAVFGGFPMDTVTPAHPCSSSATPCSTRMGAGEHAAQTMDRFNASRPRSTRSCRPPAGDCNALASLAGLIAITIPSTIRRSSRRSRRSPA